MLNTYHRYGCAQIFISGPLVTPSFVKRTEACALPFNNACTGIGIHLSQRFPLRCLLKVSIGTVVLRCRFQ